MMGSGTLAESNAPLLESRRHKTVPYLYVNSFVATSFVPNFPQYYENLWKVLLTLSLPRVTRKNFTQHY